MLTGSKWKLLFISVAVIALAVLVAPMNAGPKGSTDGIGAGDKPLGYAIAFDQNLFTVFLGVLEFGSGIFKPTSVLEVPLAGLGRSLGNIYGLDIYGFLWQVNQGNGKLQPIGNSGITGPTPSGVPEGFVIDVFGSMADGRLFAMDFANKLYLIDPVTGAATLVGSTGLAPIENGWASGFAGDCQSLYFLLAEWNSDGTAFVKPPSLYRIDPNNASLQYIGGIDSTVAGAAFVDGTLYGFAPDSTGGPVRILSYDLTNGAETLVSIGNVAMYWGAVNHDGARVGHCK